MPYLRLFNYALLCLSTTLAVRDVETIEDMKLERMQLAFNLTMTSNLSVTVTPAELEGTWMNSAGQTVTCTNTDCQFEGESETYTLQSTTVSLKRHKPIEAVALGSSGWAAVRSSASGIAWLGDNSGTVWWDKVPTSPLVAKSIDDTRWHNDVGESIHVSSTSDGHGMYVCFGSSGTDCYPLERSRDYGYLTFSGWVLIDYFRNSRGNMEVHWRLKEGVDPSNMVRDVAWFSNSFKPELETLVGIWMNTYGEIVECSSDACQFEDDTDVYALSRNKQGVALGNTGWIAVDFDQAGITWENLEEDQTLWWNKLPDDPASVLDKLRKVRSWTDTEGKRIMVVNDQATINERFTDPLMIVGPKLFLDVYVVVELFENHKGLMEVLWRKSREPGTEKTRQPVRRWTQELFAAVD